ncbi:MAG TPA: response regulator [Byssovorax sp.]|jgi:two-component system NtrC family sensor kinase
MSEGRILVIDDSWVVLDAVRTPLAALGFEVRVTSEYAVAERQIRQTDLCIIDFHMPGLDGKAMTKSLRAALGAEGSACAFYLYTSDPDVARQHAELGFDGSILKKGDAAALVSQVSAVFRTIKMKKLAREMRKARGEH